MPFAFLVVGIVFVIASVRGTSDQLLALLKSDFTGKGNFIYWIISILIIGAVGYIPDLKPISRAFLVLVILVLFLSNKGVFAQFTNAISTTQKQPTSTSTTQQQPTSATLPTLPTLPGVAIA